MGESDRRGFPRVKVHFNVEVYHPRYGLTAVRTKDMSDGGICIVAESPENLPPPGTVVSVTVKGLHGEEEPVLDMQVVRGEQGALGLSFLV